MNGFIIPAKIYSREDCCCLDSLVDQCFSKEVKAPHVRKNSTGWMFLLSEGPNYKEAPGCTSRKPVFLISWDKNSETIYINTIQEL